MESQQAELVSANKPSNASLDDRLEKLYRENLKLCEDVQHIIDGKSNDMNLLDSLNILAGLREASEESLAQAVPQPAAQRTASGKLNRVTKKGGASKGGATALNTDVEMGEEANAAPSPRINLSNRHSAKDKPSRSGSIPTTREASVKLEDGAESVASSADGATSATTGPTATTGGKSGTSTRPSNRLVLTKGEIVFCRHTPSTTTTNKSGDLEGEGILCRVTNVIGEGKQRRYEVQDADTSGEAPPPQRASVSQLIQIPEINRGLSDLGKGRGVLAQYPDTTTFYKAEVQESWRGEGGKELVKLRFEDDEVAREVERRFVLTEK